RLVASGDCRHAVHWAGGLHHALRRRAAGFCIYNDAAVAIAELRRQGARVAYVDIDAHHGDGVQWLFYDDPGVLTVSFHETGRYLFPGTGWVHERGAGDAEGTKVNVPLEPFTEDASFLEAFETVLPPLLAAFRPDVLVSQHGCDAHWLDPLADLQLTTRSFEVAAGRLHRLAHTFCGGRWVVLGGGGYAAWQVVPRVWTLTWAVVAGRCPPERLPEAWLDRWRDRSPVLLPERLRDAPDAAPPVPRREAIAARNRRTAAAALEGALAALRPGAGGLRPPAWG
ncbi:MAG: acetoin utilization protein AcuC, partial [Clostridia bacterium]|nr:acetoin utilization protein AcuC [Clostridia bacterium]